MKEKLLGDIRKEDIDLLKKYNLDKKWVEFWEEFMCDESDKILDENQRFWHTSRLSFLSGYLLAKKGSWFIK